MHGLCRCTVASILTVALHRNLGYLTQVMEELLRAAIEQPNNAQHKLVLRRTQSIVEKVLTNWMSVCLYGFLRVGTAAAAAEDALKAEYNLKNNN